MKKAGLKIMLMGLVITGLAAVCLHSQTIENEQAWKRLKKMRVRAGVMISKGRPNYTEAYVRLTDIRAMIENAGIMEPVTILLYSDFGAKIFLGTYAPVITATEGGGQKITFPTIPNAFLVTRALSFQLGDLYPFHFLDRSGKVRAIIRIRLMGDIEKAF
ncbi:MAG: hypothetical protein JXI33_04385 [Candidatus Aminicenantes bacterium]|nr:hypothetical protein [Candidatus Aminicenantes bacterium]